ncbi:MAG TPA: hypothetical protein VLH19_00900 [Patescibacteria group bacterium]|nr:hypothetical protein [Patescibacteria group bacterium]
MNKNMMMGAGIAAIVVAGGAGFFGGMQYQKSKAPTFGNGTFVRMGANGGRQGAFGGRANGMRPVAGDVIAKDDKSITVKMPDGSSKIVLLSGTTVINKEATGTLADISVGTKVGVFGTENSDGSVTAQNIQLNPMIRMLGVSPAPTASPAAK